MRDYNTRIPALLAPPRLQLPILIAAAPGMAAVCWRNAYYAVDGSVAAGVILLLLHPIAVRRCRLTSG